MANHENSNRVIIHCHRLFTQDQIFGNNIIGHRILYLLFTPVCRTSFGTQLHDRKTKQKNYYLKKFTSREIEK
jgi:hypothetical protein